MSALDEPLNPAQSERAVKACTNKVSFAQIEYRKSGDAYLDAFKAHRIATTRAEFSAECPRVVRGEVTVGDRESWVRRECGDEIDTLKTAEIMRENAIEALRSARNELQGAMAVNASVREAYRSAVDA